MLIYLSGSISYQTVPLPLFLLIPGNFYILYLALFDCGDLSGVLTVYLIPPPYLLVSILISPYSASGAQI